MSAPTSSASTTPTYARPARSISAHSAVDLVEGQRHTGGSIRLSGDRSVDDARLATLLAQLREQRGFVADDPFLLYNTEPTSTERIERGSIPEPDAALGEIRSAGNGRDLVGIYASGDTFQGFANSLGQRNWFQSSTFNLDWCFYLRADKAAKNLYAGFDWDDDAFAAKIDWSARQVKALERDPIIEPIFTRVRHRRDDHHLERRRPRLLRPPPTSATPVSPRRSTGPATGPVSPPAPWSPRCADQPRIGTYVSPIEEVTSDTLPLDDQLEAVAADSRGCSPSTTASSTGPPRCRGEHRSTAAHRLTNGDSGRIEQHFRFVYPT